MRVSGKLGLFCDAALALLYPQACAACELESVERRADWPACEACWRQTRIFSGDEALCEKCGALASPEVAKGARSNLLRCRRCEGQQFTAARACGVYEGALRAAVLRLKREPHVGARLAELLGEAQRREPLNRATRILPVPLAPQRERERGFNQAALLARTLAASSRLACDEWSLVRVAHTPHHRAGMDARARRESVEKAFRVARPRLIGGESVLLVDDVFTTGATVSSAAAVLRQAGAREVFVLTIARAVRE